MKSVVRLVLAVFGVAAWLSPALASDIPGPRRAEMAPVRGPAVLPFNWGGLYAGVNIGGGWANDNVDGILGGAQIGYNWQVGQLVFGIETDIQISGLSGTLVRPASGGNVLNETQDLDWLGTTRARIGYAVWDRWLPYFTVGIGYGTRSVRGTALTGAGAVLGSYSSDDTGAGLAIGVGVDYAINPWWSARLEYLHVSLDGFNRTYAFPPAVTASYGDLDINIFRGALNYRLMP